MLVHQQHKIAMAIAALKFEIYPKEIWSTTQTLRNKLYMKINEHVDKKRMVKVRPHSLAEENFPV